MGTLASLHTPHCLSPALFPTPPAGVQRFDGKSPKDLAGEIEAKLAEDAPKL